MKKEKALDNKRAETKAIGPRQKKRQKRFPWKSAQGIAPSLRVKAIKMAGCFSYFEVDQKINGPQKKEIGGEGDLSGLFSVGPIGLWGKKTPATSSTPGSREQPENGVTGFFRGEDEA